ncbi:MAG: methionine--tRNA ligase [Dehalococcoidia bacterium]|nr:methionine--tRNA ligase [Dehalococcoidia bacterium]
MPERIFIGVAWPYANGPLHLGHITGCYLPADIFARYHRMKGDEVLMVSGSDQHGTPVTIRAEQEGISVPEVVAKYHKSFQESWTRLGISFDLFTTTGTENHHTIVHQIFTKLHRQGDIYPNTEEFAYCENDKRFLPDRYVDGTCPHCGNQRARGDQCEKCGRPMNPQDLLNWRCKLCGHPPVLRPSEHQYLKLSAYEQKLADWIDRKGGHWRSNAKHFTRQWLADGLRDRSITRDMEWGVPVPLPGPGYDNKRIYVWFEACIGYVSAAVEWAQRKGQPDKWRDFWQDPACRHYYFIGKDNIPFHTIIWPAMLMAYGDYNGETGRYNLPYDVPANEFLSLEGDKFSTSLNWAVWVPDFLERYAPDALRYHLSATMPETSDSDFSWRDFLRRNNDELVATFGNLVHRTLTLTHRNFAGQVPAPGALDADDKALLAHAQERVLHDVGSQLEVTNFRAALAGAMGLAQAANKYLDTKAPWKTIATDRERTATTLWVALTAISALKTAFTPFLPFTAAKLHTMMGFSSTAQDAGWRVLPVSPGQALQTPTPLFIKLDDKIIEEETARLEAGRAHA